MDIQEVDIEEMYIAEMEEMDIQRRNGHPGWTSYNESGRKGWTKVVGN